MNYANYIKVGIVSRCPRHEGNPASDIEDVSRLGPLCNQTDRLFSVLARKLIPDSARRILIRPGDSGCSKVCHLPPSFLILQAS